MSGVDRSNARAAFKANFYLYDSAGTQKFHIIFRRIPK